jgi:hypothetical protein
MPFSSPARDDMYEVGTHGRASLLHGRASLLHGRASLLHGCASLLHTCVIPSGTFTSGHVDP